MTAVAPPPFQPIASRSGWSSANGASKGVGPMTDDFSKMVMPRRTVQRSNSSSSVLSQASSSSSASTLSASSANVNGASTNNGWDGGTKKRPARSLWPASKADPISGISTARPQSIASTTGPSATSAMTALHTPSSMLPSQNGVGSQVHSNGIGSRQGAHESAMLWLAPMNGTFERKQIIVPFYPDVVRIGRQTNNKTLPQASNGYFDSKVLSRQHAEIWADRSGKILIRDVKSSNGTFVNGQRLSPENKDSEPSPLNEQDLLELGIDIVGEDQKTVVHHKVAAKVELAGIYQNKPVMDLNFGDLDAAAASGALGGGQDMGVMRGRSGSQGSTNSNRSLAVSGGVGGGMMGLGQQRHPMWLQTITMDHVVKKINTEFKMSRNLTQDLHRTYGFVEGVLTGDLKKEKSPVPILKPSPIKELKARFSDPPAPPPQQPLPEKPDSVRSGIEGMIQPFLRRSDTERSKFTSSINSASKLAAGAVEGNQLQITTLVEALCAAKKEIETHNARIKEVEEMLAQERTARESAEERAARLERERLGPASALDGQFSHAMNGAAAPPATAEMDKALSYASQRADEASSKLQSRLEQVLSEMTEMKMQMEKYRSRAQQAEEDSARDRKSLADLIDKARQDEAKRVAREEKIRGRRSRSASAVDSPGSTGSISGTTVDGALDAESMEPTEKYDRIDLVAGGSPAEELSSLLRKVNDGRPVTSEQYRQLQEAVSAALSSTAIQHQHQHQTMKGTGLSGEQLAMAAPYATLLGVVFAGVALMSWLNGWQKER